MDPQDVVPTTSPSSIASFNERIEALPPRHRHDGQSPLPMGMDWSLPPRKWEGRNTVWPHDPRTGWSYTATLPSWIVLSKSNGSDLVLLYRVQLGLQSPQGVTSISTILRQHNDFSGLLSELKREFPQKSFPPPPPKASLKMKSSMTFVEETRISMEIWFEKLLADIDVSRSVIIATFLELEASVRLFFSDVNEPTIRVVSEPESKDGLSFEGSESSSLDFDYQRLDGHVRTHSSDNVVNDLNDIEAAESPLFFPSPSDDSSEPRQQSNSLLIPQKEQLKLDRLLSTLLQRLTTSRTDMEDLLSRLNQETKARQFLTTKVKNLELDLQTTTITSRDNMEQAVLNERERFTQMQWDVEDLRRQCMDLEIKLRYEQDEKERAEKDKNGVVNENKLLLLQLEVARNELRKLHGEYEDLEVKSRADLKLLVKEVKSLRLSQSQLKHEIGLLMKDKIDAQRTMQKEMRRRENVKAANTKVLYECGLLRDRLEECSVGFEPDEDGLRLDASTPSDAVDVLTTSDNRIGLLLAEAQLLAEEYAEADDDGEAGVRKMATDMFVDNARLRMHCNAIVRSMLGVLDDDLDSAVGVTGVFKFVNT